MWTKYRAPIPSDSSDGSPRAEESPRDHSTSHSHPDLLHVGLGDVDGEGDVLDVVVLPSDILGLYGVSVGPIRFSLV